MIAALEAALDQAADRPRLRGDAEIGERITRWGERDAVVHAPGTGYFRLHGDEVDVVRRLDGSVTVGSLASDALDGETGDTDFESVIALVADLYAAGLLERRPVDVYRVIEDRMQSRLTRRMHQVRDTAKRQTIAWSGVDRFFTVLYERGGRFIFAAPVVALSAVVVVLGVVGLLATSDSRTGSAFRVVSGGRALSVFGLVLVALFFHESGHALAVKRARRKVVNGGFRLYLGHPAFFVDSTDLVYGTPRQRAVNAVSGPWVEATLAGLAALFVWAMPDSGAASTLRLFAGVTYVNVALNLIPFIELDGYWLLSDVLDVPQLRGRAFGVLRREVPGRMRRSRPALTRAERALAAFGVLGAVFTVGAFAFAINLWLPIAKTLGSAAWNAGIPGRIAFALVMAIIAGPLLHPVLDLARAGAARLRGFAHDVRFRAESRWRIEAAMLIASLPTLGAVDDELLSDLAGRVRRRRVRAGEAIVRQGEAATSFFIVRRGECEVVERDVGDGHKRVLRRLREGDAFGELALLDHRPRTADVVATTDCDLFELDAGAFQRLLAPSMEAPALAPALGPALELQTMPLFRGLSLDEAALLAARAGRRNVGPGEQLVGQGDRADGFYVLVSGQAQVERDGKAVATLRAGDHFGETALLERAQRNATVRTTTPSQVLRIDPDTFSALVASVFRTHRDTTSMRQLGGEFA